MSLCSGDEQDLKQVLMCIKQQTGSRGTNLRTLGKMLWKMEKFDLAEKYFTRLLKELPQNDRSCISLYKDLEKLALQTGDHEKSIQWNKKLVEFKEQTQLAKNSNINKPNNSISKFIKGVV